MDPVRACDIHTEDGNEGLSPVKVFVVMMTLLIAGAVWLSAVLKDDDRAASAPSPSPALTTPHARPPSKEFFAQRLRELEDTLAELYEERDLSLLPRLYASDSPLWKMARRDIQRMVRARVHSTSKYKQLDVRLLSATVDKALLIERAIVTFRFFNADGVDITEGRATQVQFTKWTLKRQDGRWLIYKGVVQKAHPLNK